MDEGKGIGSQTHGAGLLPAGFGLARRRTVAPPPNVAPLHTYPTESACASGAGVATPRERPPKCGERADATARAWLTQKLCPSPLCSFQRQAHAQESLLFVPQAELARAARAWQRPKLHVSPRVERAVHGRRGACVAQLQHSG